MNGFRQSCKVVEQRVTIAGQSALALGTVCQRKDGQWVFVSCEAGRHSSKACSPAGSVPIVQTRPIARPKMPEVAARPSDPAQSN